MDALHTPFLSALPGAYPLAASPGRPKRRPAVALPRNLDCRGVAARTQPAHNECDRGFAVRFHFAPIKLPLPTDICGSPHERRLLVGDIQATGGQISPLLL